MPIFMTFVELTRLPQLGLEQFQVERAAESLALGRVQGRWCLDDGPEMHKESFAQGTCLIPVWQKWAHL